MAGNDCAANHSATPRRGATTTQATPFSPPSGPPQRLFHEHPAKSKFLAT